MVKFKKILNPMNENSIHSEWLSKNRLNERWVSSSKEVVQRSGESNYHLLNIHWTCTSACHLFSYLVLIAMRNRNNYFFKNSHEEA